jgi:hypothetical protein
MGKLTLTHALQDQNEENCKGESTLEWTFLEIIISNFLS